MTQEIFWMSASELAAKIKAKKLSPVEVVKSFLKRIEAVNPKLNAIVTLTADSAMAVARKAEDELMKGKSPGMLHGVPFVVKDMTLTKGVRTTMGSRLLENFIPDEDAILVERLKQAGGILLGKTNTPEFALVAITDNSVFGMTLNPWDLSKTPGGSSGGSTAAVAAGLCPLATGNDAGGSLRIPASCCGVVGFKPQYGRIPVYPNARMYEFRLFEGPITRTVKDAALMLDVMAGPHWGDYRCLPAPGVKYANTLRGGVKGLKVAWTPSLGYTKVAKKVLAVCEKAVRVFEDMGAIVEEESVDWSEVDYIHTKMAACDALSILGEFGTLEEVKPKLYPQLAKRVSAMPVLTAPEFFKVMFQRNDLIAKIGKFFQKYDLMLVPTNGVLPWAKDLFAPTDIDGEPSSWYAWNMNLPFNHSGQPAVSVPAGFADGLPVGIQIVGKRFDEPMVFRAAAAFEQASPWTHLKPPI